MVSDMLGLSPSEYNLKAMETAKNILNLPEGKRRTLMRSVGRRVRKNARDNTRAQENIDGSKWAPRKKRKDKIEYGRNGKRKNNGKMLKNITKGKHLNVRTVGSDAVKVDWARPGIGRLAKQHQDGMDVFFSMAANHQSTGMGHGYGDPATERQAKALVVSGFKIRKARKQGLGKKWAAKRRRKHGASPYVRPTLKWVQDNLTFGQAGLILADVFGYGGATENWQIKAPARSFLGVNLNSEVRGMLEELYEQMLERERAARFK